MIVVLAAACANSMLRVPRPTGDILMQYILALDVARVPDSSAEPTSESGSSEENPTDGDETPAEDAEPVKRTVRALLGRLGLSELRQLVDLTTVDRPDTDSIRVHVIRPSTTSSDAAEDDLQRIGESFALLLQLLRRCTNWNGLVESEGSLTDALARLTEHEFTEGTMGYGVHTERTVERLANRLRVTGAAGCVPVEPSVAARKVSCTEAISVDGLRGQAEKVSASSDTPCADTIVIVDSPRGTLSASSDSSCTDTIVNVDSLQGQEETLFASSDTPCADTVVIVDSPQGTLSASSDSSCTDTTVSVDSIRQQPETHPPNFQVQSAPKCQNVKQGEVRVGDDSNIYVNLNYDDQMQYSVVVDSDTMTIVMSPMSAGDVKGPVSKVIVEMDTKPSHQQQQLFASDDPVDDCGTDTGPRVLQESETFPRNKVSITDTIDTDLVSESHRHEAGSRETLTDADLKSVETERTLAAGVQETSSSPQPVGDCSRFQSRPSTGEKSATDSGSESAETEPTRADGVPDIPSSVQHLEDQSVPDNEVSTVEDGSVIAGGVSGVKIEEQVTVVGSKSAESKLTEMDRVSDTSSSSLSFRPEELSSGLRSASYDEIYTAKDDSVRGDAASGVKVAEKLMDVGSKSAETEPEDSDEVPDSLLSPQPGSDSSESASRRPPELQMMSVDSRRRDVSTSPRDISTFPHVLRCCRVYRSDRVCDNNILESFLVDGSCSYDDEAAANNDAADDATKRFHDNN